MPVALRGATCVVVSLRAHDLNDLMLHQLVQHAQAGTHGQRQQALLRDPGDLRQRDHDLIRQRKLRGRLGRGDLHGV